MNKRAFVVMCAGGHFQTYLPDYILFAEEAYPDADVIILNGDKKIEKKIAKGLAILQKNNYRFRVYNLDYKKLGISKIANKSGRIRACYKWILNLDVFKEYDELYLGDLDLLIMKEDKDLFEQHKKHADFIGYPYSNIVRVGVERKVRPYKKMFYYLKFGHKAYKNVSSTPSKVKNFEMTGLCYINVNPYFKAVDKLFDKYSQMLSNFFENNPQDQKFYLMTFSDEQMLYSMMHEAFGSVPKTATNDGFDSTNTESYSYRPHHGLHLKAFLASKESDTFTRICKSKIYSYYINCFIKIAKTPIWNELMFCRNRKYKKILKLIKEVYLDSNIHYNDSSFPY